MRNPSLKNERYINLPLQTHFATTFSYTLRITVSHRMYDEQCLREHSLALSAKEAQYAGCAQRIACSVCAQYFPASRQASFLSNG